LRRRVRSSDGFRRLLKQVPVRDEGLFTSTLNGQKGPDLNITFT
jgi:hypothetical protein